MRNEGLGEERLNELIAEITAAFDGVSRGNGVTLHGAGAIDDRKPFEELQAARQLDTERRWQDVSGRDLLAGDSPLPFFEAEGCHNLLGLLGHLLLHLQENIVAHRPLHQRCLHFFLHIHQHLHIFFQIPAHERLHGVPVEADDVRQHVGGEHGRAVGFFFEDDLEQNAARNIVARFGIQHDARFTAHDQLFDFRQRDVA